MAASHHEMRDKPYRANRTPGAISRIMNQAGARGLSPGHSPVTTRGTNSRQPPSASARAFGIQRRT